MADMRLRTMEKAGGPVLNHRRKVLLIIIGGIVILAGLCLWGLLMDPSRYAPNYDARLLAPSLAHPFGTDNLGRDMFYRTICGLSTSIQIGLLSALVSSIIALILGSLSAVFGGKLDTVIGFLVLEFIDEADHRKVGIEIHSGKNRVVRRLFEAAGYDVRALDRVYFAGLTKKGLKKGEWRYLSESEVNILKMGAYV